MLSHGVIVGAASLGLLLLPGHCLAQRGHGGGHAAGAAHGGHGGHATVAVHGGHGAVVWHGGAWHGGVRVYVGGRWGWGAPGGYGRYSYPWYGGSSYPGYYGGPYYAGYAVPYDSGTAVYEAYPAAYPDVEPAGGYQSLYPPDTASEAPPPPSTARLTISLPDPNAEVWFNGTRVNVRGSSQTFTTPPLIPGTDYHYQVKARWMQNGREVVREQIVSFRAGERVAVTFRPGPADSSSVGHQAPDLSRE
jgi:uncharacterized protein (TIGR03000 family)